MIVVFGSLNMDIVMPVQAMPRPGETILCPQHQTISGGKGANQAVAAALSGSEVRLFGKVGDDEFGRIVLSDLKKNKMDVGGIQCVQGPTGCAFVYVDQQGENMIAVASGANQQAREKDVPQSLLGPQTTVIVQMEAPAEESFALLKRASKAGARTILNLAPAHTVTPDVFEDISVVIVNQIESTVLALHLEFDVISPAIVAQRLSAEHNITCIVTLGAEGALACTPQGIWSIEAMQDIVPVDTTAAGDAFVGVFAASLDQGNDLPASLRRATVASGLTCLTRGAALGFSSYADIQAALPKVFPAKRRN